MKAPTGNGCRQSDFFPPTHWSVVLAAASSQTEPEIAHAALAELCQTYWAPLYSFVRSRGYSVHDAQDLTQGFFAYLIEHKIYTRVDRQKGKFRSFLLASLKIFLETFPIANGHSSVAVAKIFCLYVKNRSKRRNRFSRITGPQALKNGLFDRSWAEALVTAGLERLSADYRSEAKEKLFNELRDFSCRVRRSATGLRRTGGSFGHDGVNPSQPCHSPPGTLPGSSTR